MTTTTVDPRAKARNLMEKVRVFSLETGKALPERAARGRIIASIRGYQNTLCRIEWNGVSPEAVREALDELREAE